MATLTTLALNDRANRPPAYITDPAAVPEGDHPLRYAFVALLAANLFVMSGAISFVVLYFSHP